MAGNTWWKRWLSKHPGQDGEELDDEDIVGGQGGGSRTQSSHHAIFINHFVVCMTLGLFWHVEGFFQAPKYFLQMNILSRIPSTIIGQGIPCV